MSLTQSDRPVSVSTPLETDKLVFWKMTADEGLGKLFHYRLDLLSEDSDINFNLLLGEQVKVWLQNDNGETRYFNGLVAEVTYSGQVSNFEHYQVILRPWLWFLTISSGCRIFQNKAVPDIIKQIFRDNSFSDFEEKLSETYQNLEYCVQYNETDFNFVSRLMESAGIYYYFRHDEHGHKLVLADSVEAHKDESQGDIPYFPPENKERRTEEHIFSWLSRAEVQSGTYSVQDTDYHNPPTVTSGQKSDSESHSLSEQERYEFHDYNSNPDDTKRYARIRLEELKAMSVMVCAEGNSIKLGSGRLFTLQDYPRDDQNIEYLITHANFSISLDDYTSSQTQSGGKDSPLVYQCRFEAISRERAFRPARLTAKPVVYGAQTAVVVGAKDEEINIDQHGRIKVRFYWSRDNTGNSCWVRVSQSLAGNKWGSLHIPRVGQEVIVHFINGDPDRPIVTGAVYNTEMPPPYSMPANKTQSGIKTRSSTKGTAENFNELRFEDKKGSEEVYLHAERTFTRIVENDDFLSVGFEKSDPGDQSVQIYGNRSTMLETGNDSLELKKGDQSIDIAGKQAVDIAGNQTVSIKGDQSTEINGKQQISAKGGISQKSPASIELKVGGSSIKIEPAKITIKSPQVEIKADGKLDIKSPMTTVSGDAVLTLKGGIIKIN
ncbi:type VI secretion system tip protein VgrG [Vibrio albus]|uniref:Type VI secretion system tip protein VgrG n=1 Tax=Vibrio albus TaxID=2200953 RepID=A0A2U3BBD3_9VIBR|nr:type VI secretion system tip protein TssI/VgrG [Vibrio albus]PWI34106.1 type VI secretion system tip protein VgrG [Vibrio albus]